MRGATRHTETVKRGPDKHRKKRGRTSSVPRLEPATVPTRTLHLYPGNPRRGNVDAIKESLERNGQYKPLVVNRRTMEVLAGNHTLRALRELRWPQASVVLVDADEEQARRIVLVDNRTSDLAEYDSEQLLELLSGMESLEGTGYDETALDSLLEELSAETDSEDDDVPPAPAEPNTRAGALYRLGEHLVICGDARDPDTYARLLGSEKAAVLFTDPPYGVSYTGRTKNRLQIQGDAHEPLEALLRETYTQVDGALLAGAPLYICHPAGAQAPAFYAAFAAQGWELRQGLVWVKDAMVLSHADYHYRHEAVMYGFKPGEGRLGRGGERWYGGHRQTSVLEIERPRASREHPTMKPPALVEVALRNSSRRREVVLDPFAGSGSTLVACQRLGRRARLIEIDPRYCDVIVQRFERLTGKQAELVED